MKTFEYTIKDELGIHARPAGLLVKEAKKYESECTITKDGKTKKLTQLMMLMSLGVKQGDTVTVSVDGADEDAAVAALKEVDGQMFICADHGNCEQLVDYETGEPFTAHTTNPVPFILVNADPSYTLRENGCLADIIPTLIELMGMEQPVEMTGKSLLIKK